MLALMSWPWQVALPAIQLSWEGGRSTYSERLVRFTDRFLHGRQPLHRNRFACVELVCDEADDEAEEDLLLSTAPASPPWLVCRSRSEADSSPRARQAATSRRAPQFAFRC